MPITLPHPITALSEEAFHKLDYSVMAIAFDIHNQMGRFYDEQIYKNKLKQQCYTKGFNVESEVEIKLTHKNYSKSLFIDLLINNTVYELKTIKSIQDPQRTQTMDYLFTSNTQHGKIINFRPSSVEHEFVSTTLDHESRKKFHIQSSRWKEYSEKARQLTRGLSSVLNDWGSFLDTHLYEKALIHILGGDQNIIRSIEIHSDGLQLGQQKFACLSDSEFFLITAAKNNTNKYEAHLKCLLSNTPMEVLYWINLNRSTVQLVTLDKKSFCS